MKRAFEHSRQQQPSSSRAAKLLALGRNKYAQTNVIAGSRELPPESPCPALNKDDTEEEFQTFSKMLETIPNKSVVFSTPRKKNRAGALSLLSVYDSEDSQQSTDGLSITAVTKPAATSAHTTPNKKSSPKKDDYFNMRALNESLDSSLQGNDASQSLQCDDHDSSMDEENFGERSIMAKSITCSLEKASVVEVNNNLINSGNDAPQSLQCDDHDSSMDVEKFGEISTIAKSVTRSLEKAFDVEMKNNLANSDHFSAGPIDNPNTSEEVPTVHENSGLPLSSGRALHESSEEDNHLDDSWASKSLQYDDHTDMEDLNETSSLAQTLPLSFEEAPEINNNELINSGNSSAATPNVLFLEETNEQLRADVLSSIDVSLGNAIVLPLDTNQDFQESGILTELLQVEAEQVAVELPQVDAVDPNPQIVTEVVNGPDYPKPRRSNPGKWRRNIVKQMNDAGIAHVSLRGKQREERKQRPGCKNTCKKKCHQNFNENYRRVIFRNFWDIKNHTMQWYFIAGMVKSVDIKKRTVHILHAEEPRRKFNYSYHLPSEDGPEVEVCQKYFVDTLGINQKWVRSAILKQRANHGSVPQDQRGKIKKVSPVKAALRKSVIDHIKSFPTIEGHYTRKRSKSLYLHENLNRRIMHSLYVLDRQGANSTNIATLRQYRDIFNSEFNLKFYKPKKDQCPRCLSWKNKTIQERTEKAKEKFDKHLADKERSNQLKALDIEMVKESEELRKTTCVLTCDLEKVLECPKGKNKDFFFASKINVYNFTIFVSGEQQGINYVWDQVEARRGSAEITSSLWHFITKLVESGTKTFIIYSDNCSGQNKNQFLFSMYVMATIRYGIKITHRYLEVGHTHMEVDSVHATIEKSTKHTDIFVPTQWFTAIRGAKKSRPFYEVRELCQDQIFDFKPLADHLVWDKARTSEFKELVVDSATPGIIKYKTEYDNDHITMNIMKRTPGRPVNWKTISLTRKYTSKIPVPALTLKHVQDLCKSGGIPSLYHPYYLQTLPQIVPNAVPQPPPDAVPEWEDSDLDGSISNDSSSEEGSGSEDEQEVEDNQDEDEDEDEEEEDDPDFRP